MTTAFKIKAMMAASIPRRRNCTARLPMPCPHLSLAKRHRAQHRQKNARPAGQPPPDQYRDVHRDGAGRRLRHGGIIQHLLPAYPAQLLHKQALHHRDDHISSAEGGCAELKGIKKYFQVKPQLIFQDGHLCFKRKFRQHNRMLDIQIIAFIIIFVKYYFLMIT